MIKMTSKGDLVYVPSQVTLYRYFNTSRGMQVRDFCKLDTPKLFLVVEPVFGIEEIGVHHNGGTWYVKQADIFVEEKANDNADGSI
jgi:hypothetical protein